MHGLVVSFFLYYPCHLRCKLLYLFLGIINSKGGTERALVVIKLQLLEILQERDEVNRVGEYEAALDVLRQVTLSKRPEIFNLTPEGIVETSLVEKQSLDEPTFTSTIPVVGPAIAFFRKSWNGVSTKWYVRALIQQQMEFNKLVTRLLGEQDWQVEELAQEIDFLTNALLRVHQRLNQLENQLSPDEKDEQV